MHFFFASRHSQCCCCAVLSSSFQPRCVVLLQRVFAVVGRTSSLVQVVCVRVNVCSAYYVLSSARNEYAFRGRIFHVNHSKYSLYVLPDASHTIYHYIRFRIGFDKSKTEGGTKLPQSYDITSDRCCCYIRIYIIHTTQRGKCEYCSWQLRYIFFFLFLAFSLFPPELFRP